MNLLVQDIWNQVTNGFARLHGTALKDLWLKYTRPLSFTKGLFILGVPNLFVQEWLERKYSKDLEAVFQQVTGCPVKIMIRVDGYLYRLMKEMQGQAGKGHEEKREDDRETARYVVRPENKLVYSTFERLFRESTSIFNPIYFFGPEGVGKTHLIRQFLRKSKEINRFPAWYMVDAAQFAKEFGQAARVGDRVRFRGAVLRSDLLIIEDIHDLEGKLKLQKELLSILKFLTERKRQVVLTSNCHPRDIKLIQEPLASFLLSGMVVSVPGYSLNSTIEILSARCREKGLKASPALVETVARTSNGGLNGYMKLLERVLELADLKGESPSPTFLKEHFPEYARINFGVDSVERILDLVSSRLDVQRDLIASNSKIRKAVLARHLVIYLASTLLQTPARRVCRWLGNISPSIVPYARKKIDMRRQQDRNFNLLVLELQSEVEGGQQYLF